MNKSILELVEQREKEAEDKILHVMTRLMFEAPNPLSDPKTHAEVCEQIIKEEFPDKG